MDEGGGSDWIYRRPVLNAARSLPFVWNTITKRFGSHHTIWGGTPQVGEAKSCFS
jgi:hypothetical protein